MYCIGCTIFQFIPCLKEWNIEVYNTWDATYMEWLGLGQISKNIIVLIQSFESSIQYFFLYDSRKVFHCFILF